MSNSNQRYEEQTMVAKKKVEQEVVLPVISDMTTAEREIAVAEQKYTDVVYDVTTVAGLAEAKAAKKELTTLRTTIEKVRKLLKQPFLDQAAEIDGVAKRLTERVAAIENPIKELLEAEESRQKRAEAERLAAIEEENRALREQLARAEAANQEAKAVVEKQQAEAYYEQYREEAAVAIKEKFGCNSTSALILIDLIIDGEIPHVSFYSKI